ncbi:MAG: hypothetical protein NVS3B26_05480 [Mycobacteriales bacterium]
MSTQRWVELVEEAAGGPVSVGTMFGCKGLRTGRKFFALWWHDRLVVKVPPGAAEEAVSGGLAEPFEPMEGRPMRGWIVLEPGADWTGLTGQARAFVESLASEPHA